MPKPRAEPTLSFAKRIADPSSASNSLFSQFPRPMSGEGEGEGPLCGANVWCATHPTLRNYPPRRTELRSNVVSLVGGEPVNQKRMHQRHVASLANQIIDLRTETGPNLAGGGRLVYTATWN